MSESLKKLIKKHPDALMDMSLLKSLMKIYYPDNKLKRNLLYYAAEEGIPAILCGMDYITPHEEMELGKLFEAACGCKNQFVLPVITIWANALGIPRLSEEDAEKANKAKMDDRVHTHPGREKCDTLREIRMKIAEANGIPFQPAECHHTGPCSGTCPACDAEIRYLDEQLQKKKAGGEKIILTGLTSDEDIKAGRDTKDYPLAGKVVFDKDTDKNNKTEGKDKDIDRDRDLPLMGDVQLPDDLMGFVAEDWE